MIDNGVTDSLLLGRDDLDVLARDEYGMPLDALVARAGQDEAALQRVSRLIGIALKKPFAQPLKVDPEFSATGASRTWDIDESTFDSAQVQGTWQYKLLDELKMEDWIPTLRPIKPDTVKDLAVDAMYERGFFWYLAKSARGYLCGDAATKKKLQDAVDEVKKQGGDATLMTPNVMITAAASTFATVLIQAIPWLTVAASPVLTGLLLVMGTVGVEAYCEWVTDRLQDPELLA